MLLMIYNNFVLVLVGKIILLLFSFCLSSSNWGLWVLRALSGEGKRLTLVCAGI